MRDKLRAALRSTHFAAHNAMVRIVAAFLVAPLVGTLAGAAVLEIADGRGLGMDFLLIFGLVAGFLVYPAALAIGIPAVLCMKRYGWLSFKACLLTTVVAAAVAWCIVHWPFDSGYYEHQGAKNALFGLISAAIGAAVFWFLGVRGNGVLTDRSNGQPPAAVEPPR